MKKHPVYDHLLFFGFTKGTILYLSPCSTARVKDFHHPP